MISVYDFFECESSLIVLADQVLMIFTRVEARVRHRVPTVAHHLHESLSRQVAPLLDQLVCSGMSGRDHASHGRQILWFQSACSVDRGRSESPLWSAPPPTSGSDVTSLVGAVTGDPWCDDVAVTRLVLWDIDGTLLDADGFGWRLTQRAYLEVCGSPLATSVARAGRTDRSINLELLAANGRDDSDLAALCHAIGVLAETSRDDLHAGGGRALPGALETIAVLSAQPGVVQSVLTGNLRSLGLVKLGAFGLLDRLDLGVAAFGDDHVVRADLVEVARERFLARDESASVPDIVLIGDTPLDVAAARGSGVAIVAIATGQYSVAELAAAGAPVVLSDLTDPDRVVEAVMGATPRDALNVAERDDG